MSLNIKNEHVHALAREAARRAGASQTSVIEQALEEYLARLDTAEDSAPGPGDARRHRVDQVLAGVDAIVTAADRRRLREIEEALYDDSGLPAW
jgi:antitoxin VapB